MWASISNYFWKTLQEKKIILHQTVKWIDILQVIVIFPNVGNTYKSPDYFILFKT